MLENENDIKLAKNGSKDAFIRLIKNSEKELYRISKSILKSDIDCADAIQEAILKAYQNIRYLRDPIYYKTWIIRILINECRKILKYKRKTIAYENLIEKLPENENYDYYIELYRAVEQLEWDLKIIVVLFYFEDLPLKDISRILKIPEGTIKSRLYRARLNLRNLFNINDKEEKYLYE